MRCAGDGGGRGTRERSTAGELTLGKVVSIIAVPGAFGIFLFLVVVIGDR